MKITKAKLNSIIQEELSAVLGEAAGMPANQGPDSSTKPGDKNKAPADKGDLTGWYVGDYDDEGEIVAGWNDEIYQPIPQGKQGMAHYPGLSPGLMKNVTGAFYEKDWSSQQGDRLAANAPVKPIEGPITQGPKKNFGMNKLGGNIFKEEQLKQMVREELKNLLES